MVRNWMARRSSWKQLRAGLLTLSMALPVGALTLGTSVRGQDAAQPAADAAKPALNEASNAGTRDLNGAIKLMADTIVKYEAEKKQAISIGDFSTPPGSTSGPAIRAELVKQVEAQNVKLARPSNPNAITIKGEVTRTDPNAEGKLLVKIECRMTDAGGTELGSFREKVIVDKTSDVARLLGVNGEITQTTPSTSTGTTTGSAPVPGTPVTPPAANPTTPPATTPPATTPPANPPATGTTPPAAGAPAGAAAGTGAPAGGAPAASTTPIAGNAVAEQQRQANTLKKVLANPTGVAVGTQVAASPTSPFRIELLVEQSDPGTGAIRYTAPPVEIDNGLAYVNLQKGQAFAINLINQAPHDVGVELYLDGISSFELSTNATYKQNNVWVVPKGMTFLIPGWHVDNTKSFKFLVTDTPDSLAAQKFPDRGTSSLGMISALFYYSWSDPRERPSFERDPLAGGPRASLGVGVGSATQAQKSEVLRFFGKTLLAAVTVRYEKQATPVDLPQDPDPANQPKP